MSSPLGYILNLGIAGIVLVSVGAVGLVFFETNETTAIESELAVFGNELAGDIQEVDRMAVDAGSVREVGQRSSLGEHARTDRYIVEVINRSDAGASDTRFEHADICERACLVLVTQDGDVRAVTNYVSKTPVQSSRFDGGPVYVHRPAGSDTIRFEPLA